MIYIVGAFVLGLVLMFGIWKVGIRGWKAFVANTRLIKNYWVFVIIFSVVTAGAYITGLSIPQLDKSIFISIANHVSALVFAIFTGFFAFSQVMESRFEKLTKEAYDYLGKKEYTLAIKKWEDAYAINRKHAVTLANLLEVNIIIGNFQKITEKYDTLLKISPPERQELAPSLRVCQLLLQEHNSEAKEAIKLVVEIIEAKKINKYGRWSFKDISESLRYKELKGDSKKLLDNYINYFDGSLSDEDKRKFIAGNYLLQAES